MSKKIRIIDLFAGPGGLGEGFSNCQKSSPFEIAISVESDPDAHKTLTNRAFLRMLPPIGKQMMRVYFSSGNPSDLELVKVRFPKAWKKANEETLGRPTRLGNDVIWKRIKEGKEIREDHKKDTKDQKKISKQIAQLKKQCKRDSSPLIVIGGPPCQAYSPTGRNRVRSIEGYSPDQDERYFLYREYCRVLHESQPDAFVMENVQGILSATLANGKKIFPEILKSLACPTMEVTSKEGTRYRLYSFVSEPDSYDQNRHPVYSNPRSFNIKADQFCVPQTRRRVIVLGLREDHGEIQSFLKPAATKQISVSEMIDSMPPLRSTISNRGNSIPDSLSNWSEEWYKASAEVKKGVHDPKIQKVISGAESRASILHEALTPGQNQLLKTNSSGFSEGFEKRAGENRELERLKKWIRSSNDGFANHSTKSHKFHDRKIYLFTAAYAKANSDSASPSPKSKDFPIFLAPEHKNWNSGKYADRFRCLEATKIANTITSHLKKDGHAYIHYDIAQNRCISPREAARIQTFPDDYFFEGKQGSQYHQIGNAVPPFLAKQLACHLLGVLKKCGVWC